MTALLLALWGCSSHSSGTIVGNPGQTKVVTALGDDLAYTAASADRVTADFASCEAGDEEDRFELDVDLLGGTLLSTPAGSWCELRLTLEGVVVEGEGPEGSAFSLALEPGEILLRGELSLGEQRALILELASPGWVSAGALGLPEAGEAAVEADDPLAADLAAAIESESGMYLNADEDDQVDDGEREEPLLAAVSYEPQGTPIEIEPSGCAAGPQGRLGLGWLLALLVAGRRRAERNR